MELPLEVKMLVLAQGIFWTRRGRGKMDSLKTMEVPAEVKLLVQLYRKKVGPWRGHLEERKIVLEKASKDLWQRKEYDLASGLQLLANDLQCIIDLMK